MDRARDCANEHVPRSTRSRAHARRLRESRALTRGSSYRNLIPKSLPALQLGLRESMAVKVTIQLSSSASFGKLRSLYKQIYSISNGCCMNRILSLLFYGSTIISA